jgi:hypothetical protein
MALPAIARIKPMREAQASRPLLDCKSAMRFTPRIEWGCQKTGTDVLEYKDSRAFSQLTLWTVFAELK